jgi:hypothetical protein
MSVSSEIHAKGWAERLTEHANYYLMTKWAKKSSVFEEDLLTRSQSSKARESFKAIACLATAFPDAPKYRKQLLEHLTLTPKSTASEATGVKSNIYFLIAIDFSFQTISPELIEIAKNADMALLDIAELLQDENLDVKPLLSSLEKVLAGAATKYHHFNSHLTASLFLSQQDLHDTKDWAFIPCFSLINGKPSSIQCPAHPVIILNSPFLIQKRLQVRANRKPNHSGHIGFGRCRVLCEK